MSQRTHLSHDIVNELCNLIGQRVLRMVLDEFSNSRATVKYSVLADETRDASGTEQLTVCLRWVDRSILVHEDFLGMYSLSGHGQSAEVITKCLKDVLIRCQLSFADLHGQGYDGASTMSGAISGVAQRMKEFCPNAHFTHCLAHCLNLAMSDSAKTVSLMQIALDVVHQLVPFIRNSCKRTDLFHDVQQESSEQFSAVADTFTSPSSTIQRSPSISLRPLCPTRWTVTASAINSVVCNYEHLMQTLDRIQADRGTPTDAACTARGLLKQLQQSETYFRCVVSYRLFAITYAFATAIHRPTINVAEVLRRKREVLGELRVVREQFDVIFDSVVVESERMDLDEFQLPRKRRVPARIDSGRAEPVQFNDVRSLHRAQFYEAVDVLVSTINWRLDEQSLHPTSTLEQLLTNASDRSVDSAVQDDLLTSVITYHPHLDSRKLKGELLLLAEYDIGPTIVDFISWFQEVDLRMQTHASVYDALATFLVLPATTASCERTFSELRRLKTYLRSSMAQDRLNSLAIPAAHTDMIDVIDIQAIAQDFASLNDSRRKQYGCFVVK